MSQTIKLSSPATGEFWEIPVLFEDAHLLALDKPAGLLTSPDRNSPDRPDLMRLLHDGIAAGKPWAIERGLTYLSHTHRLDADTTGVLLLAKSKPVLVALANLFSTEMPGKKFLALVHGTPEKDRFEVNAKLAPHPAKPGQMRVDERGKRARTVFETVEKFAGQTLLNCQPLTERTHQIRVHLRRARLRVAGDALYDGAPLLLSRLKKNYRLKEGRIERPLLARPALHAEQLSLAHPVTDESLNITAPWPKDLRVAVKYLREFAK